MLDIHYMPLKCSSLQMVEPLFEKFYLDINGCSTTDAFKISNIIVWFYCYLTIETVIWFSDSILLNGNTLYIDIAKQPPVNMFVCTDKQQHVVVAS